MSDYHPDRWLVVKITGAEENPLYKVFACWYGGYAGSDSWKLNSGITEALMENDVYSFEGSSGSVYYCHKDCYGTNFYGNSVLNRMIEKAKDDGITMEILPEQTNWLEITYE